MIRTDLGKRDPQKPRRKCRPGENESRCVFGWERLQRDAAAGHSSKFPRGRGGPELSGRKGVGWVPGTFPAAGGRTERPCPPRPATVGGWVSPATPRVPPLHSPHPASAPCPPVQPQWEAGCPPPLRRCCPSALPTRPLRPAPRGPTCEERFVLEQASHHPQQPVLHVLAASLLTLLIPRDQDNETPSGTPAPSSGLTASHVSPATHVPAMPSTGRAGPSPKPGSPPPGSPLRLALPHSDSSFLQAHTLLPTLSNMSLPAPISDREKSIKLAVTGSSAGGHLLLTPMALGPWLALCFSPGTGEQGQENSC